MRLSMKDGGKDASRIQEAHSEMGIFEKEGTQAARLADHTVGEFKHLLRVISLHGRYSSVCTAWIVNLSLYKNIFLL